MVLIMGMSVVALPAMVIWLYALESEIADRMLVICLLWAVLGAVPCIMLVFCSHLYVDNGDLVSVRFGILIKRIPRSELEKAAVVHKRIQFYEKGTVATSVIDCAAARELARALGLSL